MPDERNQGSTRKASPSKSKAKAKAKPKAKSSATGTSSAARSGAAKKPAAKKKASSAKSSAGKSSTKARAGGARTASKPQSSTMADMSAAISGYLRTMKGHLKDWGIEIDTLKSKADKTGASARSEVAKRLELLRSMQQEATTRVQQVVEATSPAWHDFAKGIERAVRDLRGALEGPSSRSKK